MISRPSTDDPTASVFQPSGRGGASIVDGGRISQIDDPVGGHGSTGVANSVLVVVLVVVMVVVLVVVLVVVMVVVMVVVLVAGAGTDVLDVVVGGRGGRVVVEAGVGSVVGAAAAAVLSGTRSVGEAELLSTWEVQAAAEIAAVAIAAWLHRVRLRMPIRRYTVAV